MDQKIFKELEELRNIEKQHQRMNGKLYKEVDKLKKENEYLNLVVKNQVFPQNPP